MKTINVRELRTAFLAAHRAQMATLPVALDVLIREQRDKR